MHWSDEIANKLISMLLAAGTSPSGTVVTVYFVAKALRKKGSVLG